MGISGKDDGRAGVSMREEKRGEDEGRPDDGNLAVWTSLH